MWTCIFAWSGIHPAKLPGRLPLAGTAPSATWPRRPGVDEDPGVVAKPALSLLVASTGEHAIPERCGNTVPAMAAGLVMKSMGMFAHPHPGTAPRFPLARGVMPSPIHQEAKPTP